MPVSTGPDRNYVLIVMGVSGVGKTTIAHSLAARLDAQFIEADDYHSSENRKAMEQGIPLDDKMRLPWLLSLCSAAETARDCGHVVMACSALKRQYRDLFRTHIERVQLIYLHASREAIARRIAERSGHFMPLSLLDTQIAALEPPTSDESVITIDVSASRSEIENEVAESARKILCLET
jgi:gluconokinase